MVLWMPRGNGPTCVLLDAVLDLLVAKEGKDGTLGKEVKAELDGTQGNEKKPENHGTCLSLFRRDGALGNEDKIEQDGALRKEEKIEDGALRKEEKIEDGALKKEEKIEFDGTLDKGKEDKSLEDNKSAKENKPDKPARILAAALLKTPIFQRILQV